MLRVVIRMKGCRRLWNGFWCWCRSIDHDPPFYKRVVNPCRSWRKYILVPEKLMWHHGRTKHHKWRLPSGDMASQHPSYIYTYIYIYTYRSNPIWQLCHKEWRCSRIIGNHQFHGRNSLGSDRFMPFRRTIQLDGFPMISSPRFNCTVVPPIHRFIYHSLTIFNLYLQVYTPHEL